MIKLTETYTDYNGVERTEDFYFNLTAAELVDMQLTTDGGMDVLLKKIVEAKNTKQIAKVFKKLLLKSYGEKSDDGRFFRKSDAISEKFASSPVFSNLYMRFARGEKEGLAFVEGIMPVMPEGDVTAHPKDHLTALPEGK